MTFLTDLYAFYLDHRRCELSPRFGELYARVGRPSIAPEKLLGALLLQVFYTIRSERLLMVQVDYNLLFRSFVGLEMDDPVWNPTVFTKNRERLLRGDIAPAFFEQAVEQARQRGLLSNEHFTVDGTLVEAWVRLKSFTRTDAPPAPDDSGNPTANFRGERRSNATHASTTDPGGAVSSQGESARGQAVLRRPRAHRKPPRPRRRRLRAAGEGLCRAAALELLGALNRGDRVTVGAEKAYDTRDFVGAVRLLGVTASVNTGLRWSDF